MLNGKYVPLSTVIEKVYRDFDFSEEIDPTDMYEWAGDALDLIRTPALYVERITDGRDHPMIDIVNGRGLLPCDLVHIIQTADCHGRPLRTSTDSFHMSGYQSSMCKDFTCSSELTYKVNNNYIFPSFNSGQIVMSYLAFPTDENGIPLIPDDMVFQTAVKNYIAERIAFRQMIKGILQPTIYNMIRQEKDWYIGKAQTSALIPNRDKTASIKNQFMRLINPTDGHSTGYRSISSEQTIKNHSTHRRI